MNNPMYDAQLNRHEELIRDIDGRLHSYDLGLRWCEEQIKKIAGDNYSSGIGIERLNHNINACNLCETGEDKLKCDELIALIKFSYDQICQKNMAIERLNDEIESLKEVINKRTNAINELNEQLINKDKLIKKYKKTITDNENNLSLKNDRIQELEMTVKDLKDQRDALRNANCHSGSYPWGPKPSRLSDQINLIEKRLNEIENYIFGGKNND